MENAQKAPGTEMDFLDQIDTNASKFNVSVIDDEDGNSVSGFIIVGKNSPSYKQTQRNIRVQNVQRGAKRNKIIDSKTDEGADQVVRIISQNDRETALSVIVGWYGFNRAGQPLDFDQSKTIQMLDKFPVWQEKILAALEIDANFMKV